MADIGASVLARLKNKSKETGRPNQLCVQLFCQEEFLRRLERSDYAEKLDAILDLMQLSSRMKDYYDLYYIASKFDFDGSVLVEAMRKTFANRGCSFTLVQFEEMLEFDLDPGFQKKWQQFVKKKKIEADDYSTVMQVIKEFLEMPYKAAVLKSTFAMLWKADERQWK